MSDVQLTSQAEKRAEKAEALKAFSGLKILHVKRSIAQLLSNIGKDGIFDEYTKHDISHINYMLDSLDHIIPDETKKLLTPADWLMITFSIYFHDLGMLVTKAEYEGRENTEFPVFRNRTLEGDYGADFRDKILGISDKSRRERFMYQEFVRQTHAERVKSWILEESHPKFPIALSVVNEINKLISSLDPLFKRDLALICESHYLSDLGDFSKYKTNQQYGPSTDECVNIHYAALILRTADLLHITSDRAPSIELRLINPTDPISQDEWAKQNAVKSIRPQLKKNKEGAIDPSIPKDTFEVIALFKEEQGFFGLIAYLNYASEQLKLNFKYNEQAKKLFAIKHDFPWKEIDDSNIETVNFEKKQFEFKIDQTRILDLLVGHTLYNDSTVVLRELAQNSIDASKLKKIELDAAGRGAHYTPTLQINWNEGKRELAFIDNGTGMTLDIIENHLLRVGSSRYQDNDFKKAHPDFSPISRFGIGLLTCFLIADDIDVVTKDEESDKAILLKIKKIHGKYLLKYLARDYTPHECWPHGTAITLHVRSEVKLNEIENDLKKWILFPSCKISLINGDQVLDIGFNEPADLLKTHLISAGYDVNDKQIRVSQYADDGVTLAYALKYIEHLQEWSFLEYRGRDNSNIPVGLCVEGIRVEFNTPGFIGKNIYAIANCTGKNAPKTNVARSTIELTPEREHILAIIYRIYLSHITSEISGIRSKGYSITWAAEEGSWLLNSFIRDSRHYGDREFKIEERTSFFKELEKIDCILVENGDKRELISLAKLKERKKFWTIESASYRSADSLLKEVKQNSSSALSLLNTILGKDDAKTDNVDMLRCDLILEGIIDEMVSDCFQIDHIKVIPEQRRLDLQWSSKDKPIWEEISLRSDEFSNRSNGKCYVQIGDVVLDSELSQIAINSSNGLFILKNSELHAFMVDLVNKLSRTSQEDRAILSAIASLILKFFDYKDLNRDRIEEIIDYQFEHRNTPGPAGRHIWTKVDKDKLISIVLKTNFTKYDTTIWHRRHQF